MKQRILFSLVLLLPAFQLVAFAQEQPYFHMLRGVIKNQEAAVIAGTRLDFKSPGGEAAAHTNEDGVFEVRLKAGLYELTVSRSISEKFVAFVNIQENGLNPDYIEFVVDTSSSDSAAPCPQTVDIVKPVYPMAARAVRASGEVIVLFKIDAAGKVTEAKAVSGHPLLRQAAEQAALKSTFQPAENPPERDARLTYVFIPSEEPKTNIRRYAPPCRIEVFGEAVKIDAGKIVDKF